MKRIAIIAVVMMATIQCFAQDQKIINEFSSEITYNVYSGKAGVLFVLRFDEGILYSFRTEGRKRMEIFFPHNTAIQAEVWDDPTRLVPQKRARRMLLRYIRRS